MKLKIKLSILVIAIVAGGAILLSTLLVRQAANISLDLSIRNIENLAGRQADTWKGREEGYLRVLQTLAANMADYEDIPAAERRDRFDDMLRAVLINETNMLRLFTIWKPNAIDGMDSSFIGRTGSSPTGSSP
jgi:methyl-accepting chemotaxis protein